LRKPRFEFFPKEALRVGFPAEQLQIELFPLHPQAGAQHENEEWGRVGAPCALFNRLIIGLWA
jgi:hypothetical protein